MTSMTPDQIAAHWAQQLGGATAKIQQGVQAVSTAPGQAAARQKAVWVQNTTAAADKFAANVSAVTLSDWQQAFVNKGLPRIATGASNAQPKFTAFMTKLLPYQRAGIGSLPQRGNLQQNTQRAVAWINYMAAFKK